MKEPKAEPRRLALLIGNSDYEEEKGFKSLKKSLADLTALAAVLEDKNIGAFEPVIQLPNYDGLKIIPKISKFFKSAELDDLLLFYFSGHGKVSGEEFYLVMKDGDIADLDSTAVSASFLRNCLKTSPSKRKVVILDCCQSGFLTKGGDDSQSLADAFEKSGYGHIIMTAANSSWYAFEDDKLANSLFTHFLLEGLRTGQAAIHNEPFIKANSIFEYVKPRVVEYSKKMGILQQPGWKIDGDGDMVLARNPAWRAPKVELPAVITKFLASDDPDTREHGIKRMFTFSHEADPPMLRVIREELHRLMKDDPDDFVRDKAEGVLKRLPSIQSESNELEKQRLAENQRQAKIEADKQAKLEADKQAKIEADKQAKIEADRQAKIEKQRLAAEAERKRQAEIEAEQKRQRQAEIEAQAKKRQVKDIFKPIIITQQADSFLSRVFSESKTETLDYWITIPAGEFTMGTDPKKDPFAQDGWYKDWIAKTELPQHKITLPEYQIARVPVTNEQWGQFLQGSGYQWATRDELWKDGLPRGKEKHPVVYVTWHDAIAFCGWAGVRLPTEAEWEKAARGPDGRLFPWGNEDPTKELCNFNQNVKDTTPVGQYPKGKSPYGCLDMAGNVWEWCSSAWGTNGDKPDFGYPYKVGDGREDLTRTDVLRIFRGGYWSNNPSYVRCAFRNRLNYYYYNVGFRVAVVVPIR